MENKDVKKPFYKRRWFIVLAVIFVVGSILNALTDDEKDEPEVSEKASQEIEEDSADTNITGNLEIGFKDDKTIISITTNAMDGAIFETSITDGDLNIVSDFLTIKDGNATKELDSNDKWEPGYLAGMAMMRFNLDDHPQPQEVKDVYGENGEKLEGDLAVENNIEGFNIVLETKSVPYPDEKTAKEIQEKLFSEAINELIEAGGGIIEGIKPRIEEDEWSMVDVVISDAWYNSPEHEKERFAEQVGETVVALIRNAGKVEANKTVMVYLVDAYNKELATPKILGGYKIKR